MSDALAHLDAAIAALLLEAYRGRDPESMRPAEHFTIGEDLKRIDSQIGPPGESVFARIADRIQEAYVELLSARAAVVAAPPPQNDLQGEVDRLKADRNLFAGKYRSIIVLMDDARQKVQEVVDHIQDEGDRTFLGSTNHADWLRDLVEDMDGWSFDAMLPKGDINKMERDPYADCRQLRTALKLAIEHIEHMAAFIGPLKAGYSFESLGEDMPGLKAALTSEGSADV